MVHQNIAFGHPMDDSVVTENHLLDVGGVGDADEHDVTFRAHFTWGVDQPGVQIVCLRPSSIPDRKTVTSIFEVLRHTMAHCP